MPDFKPIKQFRVSEEVAQQIKHSIVLGHFKSGEKLPSERDLAQEFQVSRIATREALRKLEHEGFILTRQGRTGGAYVINLTFEYLTKAFLDLFLANKISIPEMYQVRLLVEPEIARLSALRIIPKYAKLLNNALKSEELPVASLPIDIDRKQEVHIILAEMCGNRFLETLMKSLLQLTKKVVEAVNPEPDRVHPMGMHHSIVEAVVAGNAEAAAAAMRKHTIDFGENFAKMEKAYREKTSMISI